MYISTYHQYQASKIFERSACIIHQMKDPKGWKASLRTNPNVFTTVDLSQPAISSNLQSKMCAKLREGQGTPTLTLTTLRYLQLNTVTDLQSCKYKPIHAIYSDQILMPITAIHIPPSHHTQSFVFREV